ncbi:MAG: Na+/H+ antiporter NhaA [Selenomonas sp.]|nr:Na+/H+ antiporter NhaA [Selenomonas sp.]
MKHHISRVLEPIQSFFRHEAFSGLLLLFFAALAIILANSPLSGSYQAVLDAVPIAGPAAYHLDLSVLHWVNDGLMAIFFFVIGLEIKREFFFGELQSLSATVLPVCAAVGGMLVPALLYAAVNMGGAPAAMAGWGIPMATDIAFSLGILSVAARSAPTAIVIFLTALAIVDDLGAIIVIALFYTGSFSLIALLAGLAALAAAFALNRRGVLHIAPYLLLGLLAWFCFLNAGIHPTIAGVILAFAIPIDRTHPESSLLYALEHRLEPWSAYVIMPVFALANAGVVLPGNLAALTEPVALGIVVGLCIGKPLGVCGAVFLLNNFLRLPLPKVLSVGHFAGAGCLAGIGFTMSLFIAALAFPDPARLATAKLGIITASVLSGAVGAGIFLIAARTPAVDQSSEME